MLTVKDFREGDIVYVLTRQRGTNKESSIKEQTVTAVGRKYVTVGYNAWSQKYMDWNAEYLQEKVDFGEPNLLFKTRSDAEEYVEKIELALWLGCMSVSSAEKYSIRQLRKVKEILKGEDSETEQGLKVHILMAICDKSDCVDSYGETAGEQEKVEGVYRLYEKASTRKNSLEGQNKESENDCGSDDVYYRIDTWDVG